MTNLFFYGTLCHVPLLCRVLGRDESEIDLIPAELAGHAVYWAQGHDFPMIEANRTASATGLLAVGLSEQDIERLQFYEAGFDYATRMMTVTTALGDTAEAPVFFPDPGRWGRGEPWVLKDWVRRHAPATLAAAEEVMSLFGRIDGAQLVPLFPGIRRRAASWVAAQERLSDPVEDMTADDVELLGRDWPHVGFFAMQEAEMRARRFDGTPGPVINRATIDTGQAAVVLPYDPVRDLVLVVEQFRAPVYLAGDRHPWLREPVAGLIDPGETAEETVRREAMEEAGVEIGHLEPVGGAYASPGNSTLFLHLFVGLAELTPGDVGTGGVESEHEDIRFRVMPFDALMVDVDAGRLRDLPILTTALWLARHRDRLRAMA